MKNKEFGSDFHIINSYYTNSEEDLWEDFQFYANGRQAIIDLILNNDWKRIWMPEYFCYEIISSIEKTGIEIVYYEDYPSHDDNEIIKRLNYQKNDVLFRVNYLGIRGKRANLGVPISVIEDHSHDIMSEWAQNSDADWCVASLRKSLPIAEGGVLWSPKRRVPWPSPSSSKENDLIAEVRWKGMELKSQYLKGYEIKKQEFRTIFMSTEEGFEDLPISYIDCKSLEVIKKFDMRKWNKQKEDNWSVLSQIDSDFIRVFKKESENNNYFNFSFLLPDKNIRDFVRNALIKNNIYPVVLWNIPGYKSVNPLDVSQRILSIACDGRYNIEEMEFIKIKLEDILKNII